jgi:hypothetical protein
MAWTVPYYDPSTVDAAGRAYVDPDAGPGDRLGALQVISNWRSAHSFPLNTFQMTLREQARQRDPEANVVQRLKRLPSIQLKLERLQRLQLSEIQDIGGCRVVLTNMDQVDDLVTYYTTHTRMQHALERCNHYVDRPKGDGYRSVHLIYRYHSSRSPSWNDLQVEIQIRTRLQNLWATAVETVDLFTHQTLKTGGGDPRWKRFFQLMGSELARTEQRAIVPGTSGVSRTRRRELRRLVVELDVIRWLTGISTAMNYVLANQLSGTGRWVLIRLDVNERIVRSFVLRTSAEAAEAYDNAETEARSLQGVEVVLVRGDSLEALRRAFPNYFADTQQFLLLVRHAVNAEP